MSNTKSERQVAKKGFGTILINRLREVDHASTEELAKLANVTLEQAYSRLMFLQTQEKLVISSGKGKAKTWSMADKGAPPPVASPSAEGKEDRVAGIFNRSHGWKPSLERYNQLLTEARVGDKLLVEYPEGWRHTALVSVCRAPDEKGAALCWDIRNKMYTYVPVTPEAIVKHGCKVVAVAKEKDIIALENE